MVDEWRRKVEREEILWFLGFEAFQHMSGCSKLFNIFIIIRVNSPLLFNTSLSLQLNWDFFIFTFGILIMAASGHNNLNAKLVLLGDMGAGKSSLVIRFVKGQFLEFQESTIGAAFFSSTVSVNNSTVKFEIWDTAGQERYHSLAPMYYRGAAAAIVVYDITSTDSFARAKKWVQELQKQGNPNMVMALAGNKADLEDKRKVIAEEACLYAEENGLFFMETSAKTAVNVNDIFYEIAKRLPRAQPAQNPARVLLVDRTAEGSRAASCCNEVTMGEGASSSSKKSRKPDYSRFTQQELPACKPILTPQWVVTVFIFIGIIFIPIGLASLSASEKVVEIVHRYDEHCAPTNYTQSDLAYHDRIAFIKNNKSNKTCIRTLTVPKKMKHPIYVYYQLNNFYQNHRRYVKSRNDEQLRDPNFKGDLKKTCAPEDMNGNEPVIPCGLIAWSLFNDTYGFSINDKALPINRKNISWPSDRKHKFGSKVFPKNFQKGSLIGGGTLNESIPMSEQEDLQVWLRTAALPVFRKLYGKLEHDLEANENITVVIQNNYNTYTFEGKKSLVLSTTTWIGGKNKFLGIAYLTVGGICLFVAIIFILMYVIKPRPFGDPAYLSWNLNPTGN